MKEETVREMEQSAGVDLKERALKGEIILVSAQGLSIVKNQISAKLEEIEEAKQTLGRAAKSDPDLPENAEFKEVKTKLQFQFPKKLRELYELQQKLFYFREDENGKVNFGSSFHAEIQYTDGVEKGAYILYGPVEASYLDYSDIGMTVISYLSPLGRKIWGMELGEANELTFQAPTGEEAKCEFRRIP